MKHTIKQRRKALGTPTRLGLMAAVSGLALGAAATQLTAQNAALGAGTAGYATAGIPVGDDVYGTTALESAPGGLQPVGVGPAAQPSGLAPGYAPGGVTGTRGGLSSLAPTIGKPVRRGKWTTTVQPFVELGVTYSDNINLAPDGFEEDETVITATAGVTLGVQHERVVGALTYAASYDTFLNDTNDDGFRHNLDTRWSAAIVPNLLYLDAAGGVSEVYIDSDDRFSGNRVANSNDRSRAYYGVISPSLRRNLGGWANAELRYTLRGVGFEDDDGEGGYSQTYSAGITGDPRRFTRFGWQAVTEFEDYEPEDDDGRDLTRWTSYVSVDVPVTRTVALTATAGYDEFSDDIADDDYSGAFGNVGARWQPNNRFAARAFGGYRYDGFDYGAEATYLLNRRLAAGVQARRAVQFNDFGDGTVSIVSAGTDAQGRPQFVTPTGNLTDTLDEALATNLLTGETGRFGDVDFAPQDTDAIVDTLSAFLTGSTGKTAYGANLIALNRDYDALFEDEQVLSASLNVSRALTGRLGLDAGIGYSLFDVEDSDIDDFEVLSLGAGLNYQLTEIVNVFGRYTYTQRFADDSLDEFKENAGVVGVRASF